MTAQQLVAEIRAVGVHPGDLLLVHSSLASIGHVDGGAETAARALAQSVSPGGTVLVPTFNYGQLPYDPASTPSLTGAITEAFRRLPGPGAGERVPHHQGVGSEPPGLDR